MLNTETAQKYLQTLKRPAAPTERDFSFLPKPYRLLGQAIIVGRQKNKELSPHQLYKKAFGEKNTENPWATQDGKALAQILYGEHWAPHIPGVWELCDTLPYRTGYQRRPFRTRHMVQYLDGRMGRLRALYQESLGGIGGLPILEGVRYDVYTGGYGSDRSLLYASALCSPELASHLRPRLEDILNGEDEIGGVTRNIVKALLISPNPEDWQPVEKLLLAAQRQEGLRQTILEALDETSLGALQHFIGVILEHDLPRFSSVIRAVDTWFGFGWEAPRAKTVKRILELAADLFENPALVTEYLADRDNLKAYLALWYRGIYDVDEANKLAAELLAKEDRAKRLLALYFMVQTGRTNKQIQEWGKAHFGEDMETDSWLLACLPGKFLVDDRMYDRIVAYGEQLPSAGKTFQGTLFEWQVKKVTADTFYRFLINHADDAQLQKLSADISAIPLHVREQYVRRLFPQHYRYSYRAQAKSVPALDLRKEPWKRDVILQALADRSQSLQSTGLGLLEAIDLEEEDLQTVAGLLARKGKALRSGLIAVILKVKPESIERTVDLLLDSGKVEQRLAGLEILSELHEGERLAEFVQQRIGSYREREKFSKNERVFLEKFAPTKELPGFTNGFFAIDFGQLRPLLVPQPKFSTTSKGGMLSRLLKKATGAESTFRFANLIDERKIVNQTRKLLGLIEKYGREEYTVYLRGNYSRAALVEATIGYTSAAAHDLPAAEAFDHLILAPVWRKWYEESGLNDFELLALSDAGNSRRYTSVPPPFQDFLGEYRPKLEGLGLGKKDRYGNVVGPAISLLHLITAAFADRALLLQFKADVLEDIIARLPAKLLDPIPYETQYGGRQTARWYGVVKQGVMNFSAPATPQAAGEASADTLLHHYDLDLYLCAASLGRKGRPTSIAVAATKPPARVRYSGETVHAPSWLTLRLHQLGGISDDDVRLQCLYNLQLLQFLDGKPARQNSALQDFAGSPGLSQLLSPLREPLLALELERGELETEASIYVNQLQKIEGSDRLITTLERLGRETLERGYSYGSNLSKKSSFSKLVKKSVPAEDEELGRFLERAGRSKVSKKRWLEVAMYAPQWAPWIGELLRIADLEDAVWWFHAHASGYAGSAKETIVSRYSAIELADFRRGAIDIDWFHEVYNSVGRANWKLLHAAAKYISDGNGHRQVKLYSAIMLSELKIKETLAKIAKNRDKDYVRGLGLVPLSRRVPEKDLLKRYQFLQQFLTESKQFGNQRQESEKIAVEIALDNLARNAGFTDTVRFGWVMEGEATRKIMENATFEQDDVVLQLYINHVGKAEIGVLRGEKPLKAIPTKYRKLKEVREMKANKTALRKQLSRTRKSLEQAMLSATIFTAEEIGDIYEHPIVSVMLDQLVLMSPESGNTGFWRGDYLEGPEGQRHELVPEDQLVIAHPYYLFQRVEWDQYQKVAFDRKLKQPFKQIFRELYVVTADERETKFHSNRYQGHQIQPQKAVALLRGRGWTVSHEEGLQRVDHQRGVIATMYAAADWFSPADVEAPVIEQVVFYVRKTRKHLPVQDVDPILFSEIMRDVDLVVSVAHVGGVDPEASHSTLEMRAALARESARLFKLKNVEVKTRFVLIDGKLGNYSLHLGSAQVSKGGLALSIIAVQSQQRGRIFLPFVDDDPKSAEIISKMLLLARDGEVKDPTVLKQLVG